jgi:hypothetical protein
MPEWTLGKECGSGLLPCSEWKTQEMSEQPKMVSGVKPAAGGSQFLKKILDERTEDSKLGADRFGRLVLAGGLQGLVP